MSNKIEAHDYPVASAIDNGILVEICPLHDHNEFWVRAIERGHGVFRYYRVATYGEAVDLANRIRLENPHLPVIDLARCYLPNS